VAPADAQGQPPIASVDTSVGGDVEAQLQGPARPYRIVNPFTFWFQKASHTLGDGSIPRA
jgi:hypothetical protein